MTETNTDSNESSINPFFLLFISMFLLAISSMSNNKDKDFEDYKEMDLNNEKINCEDLITHKDYISLKQKNYLDDFLFKSKYTFKQCQEEISNEIEKECKKIIKSLTYYDLFTSPNNQKNKEILASERDIYFCENKILNLPSKLKFNKKIDEIGINGALYQFPGYKKLINLNTISEVSNPYESIVKGFYRVKINFVSGDYMFTHFESINEANLFINQISLVLMKNKSNK